MQRKARVVFIVLLAVALASLFQAVSVLAEGIPTQGSTLSVASMENGSGEYTIGPEDVLQIDVWQHPELSKTITVRFDGMITYDLVGSMTVADRRPSQVKVELEERLRTFIRDPQVTVSVIEFNSRKISILGEVPNPGMYQLTGNMRILEALTRSGWRQEKADLENVRVMRSTNEVFRVDVSALLYRGDLSQNILLQPHDTIFVPEKPLLSESSYQVLVMGEVSSPGAKSFPEDQQVTVRDVLLACDGVTEHAALGKARIFRANGVQEDIDLNRIIFQGDMGANLALRPNDTLYIPRTTLIRFYVLGMTGNLGSGSGSGAGVYESQPEHATVMTAIGMSGHARFGALLSETKIIRGWPENPVVINCNLEDLIYRGDVSQNFQLQNGDIIYIPETFLSNVLDVVSRILGPTSGAIGITQQWERAVND